jgi:hypothetical protein
MIGGFVIYGDGPKRLILRAMGPSLAAVGISEVMPDPVLTLFDSTGAVLGSNDNWRSDQSQIIQETGLAPSDDREAALVTVLSPGSYTVTINDANNASGVALFELYDLDLVSSQFINLSTRGAVQTQDGVMIGGLIIFGEEPASFVLRALGPSLVQSSIQDPLLDPVLELYDVQGSLVMQNDNWRSDQQQQVIDSQLAPSDDRESAIVANLSPGSYSAVVRGAANSTGTALFEVYKLLP